jgi:hypothetical protein
MATEARSHITFIITASFRPMREKMAADWKRQHNEQIHNMYNSLNIVRVVNQGDEMGKAMQHEW